MAFRCSVCGLKMKTSALRRFHPNSLIPFSCSSDRGGLSEGIRHHPIAPIAGNRWTGMSHSKVGSANRVPDHQLLVNFHPGRPGDTTGNFSEQDVQCKRGDCLFIRLG